MKNKRCIYIFLMLVLLFPTVLYASGGWGTLVTHNSPTQNNYGLISDGLVQVTSQDTGEAATVYTRDLYRLADALDYYISMPVVGKALIMQTAEAYGVDWNDWGTYVHPTDVDVLYTDSAYLYANSSGYADSNYDKYSGVNAGNNLSARGHITSYDTVNRVGLLPTTSIDTSQLPTFDNAKTYSFTEYGGNTLPTVSAIDDTIRRLAQAQFDRGYKKGFEVDSAVAETGLSMWRTTLSAYGVNTADFHNASTVTSTQGNAPATVTTWATVNYSPVDYSTIDESGLVVNKNNVNEDILPNFTNASTEHTVISEIGEEASYASIDDGIRRMARIQYNKGYEQGYYRGSKLSNLKNDLSIASPKPTAVEITYHIHSTTTTKMVGGVCAPSTHTPSTTTNPNDSALSIAWTKANRVDCDGEFYNDGITLTYEAIVNSYNDSPKTVQGGCYQLPYYYYTTADGVSSCGWELPPGATLDTDSNGNPMILYYPNCGYRNAELANGIPITDPVTNTRKIVAEHLIYPN